MNEQINRIIKIGGADYMITKATPINPEYKNIIRVCEETGKFPVYFGAAKVLKNGTLSEKQTKCVLIFKNTGNYVTL